MDFNNFFIYNFFEFIYKNGPIKWAVVIIQKCIITKIEIIIINIINKNRNNNFNM